MYKVSPILRCLLVSVEFEADPVEEAARVGREVQIEIVKQKKEA